MSITEKPQKIFVSLDDSIPYVLDLISSAQSQHIILVVEESSGIISTLVSMKVLLKEVIRLNKVAIIQTRDLKARHFGGQVGLIVVEQTSEINGDLWKEASKAADTFKKIYRNRKDELAIKRKAETIELENNLDDDQVWKQNLNEPNENVDFDEVVDIPVISTVDENQIEYKSQNIKHLDSERYIFENEFSNDTNDTENFPPLQENEEKHSNISDTEIFDNSDVNESSIDESQKLETKTNEFVENFAKPVKISKKALVQDVDSAYNEEKESEKVFDENFDSEEYEQKFYNSNRKNVLTNPHPNYQQVLNSVRTTVPENYEDNFRNFDAKPTVTNENNYTSNLVNKQNYPQISPKTKKLHQENFSSDESLYTSSEGGEIEIPVRQAKRPTFEELYKIAKEKNNSSISLNKSNQVEKIDNESNKVYKRYVPKLIRTSGLVIAPGGDVMEFPEISDEIINDNINFKSLNSHQYHNEQLAINSERKVYNRSLNDIEENYEEDFETSKQLSRTEKSFRKAKTEEDRSILDNVGNVVNKFDFTSLATKVGANLKNIFNTTANNLRKMNATNSRNMSSNRMGESRVNRQRFPRDPLSQSTNQRKSTFVPIDRKKIAKNAIRGFSIFLIFFVAWALVTMYFLMNAEVVFAVSPLKLKTSEKFSFEIVDQTLIENRNSESKIASRVKIESELGESLKTTTTKDLGNKAEGNVTLYNKTDQDINLPSGTKLQVAVAEKNYNFFLKNNTTIPKRIVKTIRTDNGFIDARVVYENTGQEGNIPANLLGEQNRFIVSGYQSNQLEGISFLGFSGGTSKIVKIITQADKDNLLKNVENKLKQQIKTNLYEKYSEEYEIISQDVSYELLQQDFTGNVDSEADKVDLFMKMKGEIIVIEKTKILNTINEFYSKEKQKLLQNQEVEKLQEKLENWTYKYVILDSNENSVNVEIQLDGNLYPPLSSSDLKKKIIGKNETEILNSIENVAHIKIVKVNINPSYIPEFVKRVPEDPSRLKLVFENVML